MLFRFRYKQKDISDFLVPITMSKLYSNEHFLLMWSVPLEGIVSINSNRLLKN